MEMLGYKPVSTQTMPPLPSIGTNLELVVVNTDQTEVIPTAARVAPIFGGSLDVSVLRTMVNLDHSSLPEEVAESLKRKNSWLTNGCRNH